MLVCAAAAEAPAEGGKEPATGVTGDATGVAEAQKAQDQEVTCWPVLLPRAHNYLGLFRAHKYLGLTTQVVACVGFLQRCV